LHQAEGYAPISVGSWCKDAIDINRFGRFFDSLWNTQIAVNNPASPFWPPTRRHRRTSVSPRMREGSSPLLNKCFTGELEVRVGGESPQALPNAK
jgi:hypothetical protein